MEEPYDKKRQSSRHILLWTQAGGVDSGRRPVAAASSRRWRKQNALATLALSNSSRLSTIRPTIASVMLVQRRHMLGSRYAEPQGAEIWLRRRVHPSYRLTHLEAV